MARDLFGNKKITSEDKYTKSTRITFTKSDEYWEIFKMFLWIGLGYIYFHFIIMGWTL
jgi:hypothetical protein|tara:strand:+ start:177 stop:350 length:174 start_codon:yes stop_codon:yes gene_type:complete